MARTLRRARASGVVSLSFRLFAATVVSELAYAAFFRPCEVVLRWAVAVPAMPGASAAGPASALFSASVLAFDFAFAWARAHSCALSDASALL